MTDDRKQFLDDLKAVQAARTGPTATMPVLLFLTDTYKGEIGYLTTSGTGTLTEEEYVYFTAGETNA